MKKFLLPALLLLFVRACFAEEAEPRARVVFVGDIMTHQEQIEGARRPGGGWDFAPQFRRIAPLFKDALVVGNLETVFAGEKSGYAGYPSFNAPDALADALAGLGVNVVTLANNHILDRGAKGAARTIEVLHSADILWTGLGSGDVKPDEALTLDYAGLRWAFLSYSYGSNRAPASSDVVLNTMTDEAVTRGLAHARLSGADIVVACFHWGNEYRYAPTKRQREVAALCFDNGADLVIGTHPHVLQPLDVLSSDRGYRPVAWSLGNLVSYQRTLPRERSGILAVDVAPASGDARAYISRISVAPTRVSATKPGGRHLIQVVYAGESERFNHAGLPLGELKVARGAGQMVLDFLGAVGSADSEGFYTLWDARSPDVVPTGRRKAPM